MFKNPIYFIVGIIVIITIYWISYSNSADTQVITVQKLESVVVSNGETSTNKYLVFTDKGVFENTDSFIFMKFNSSDYQNRLKEGKTYKVRVAGWRVPVMSMYKNIVYIIRPL